MTQTECLPFYILMPLLTDGALIRGSPTNPQNGGAVAGCPRAPLIGEMQGPLFHF